jgi:putative DNA primase/helicase
MQERAEYHDNVTRVYACDIRVVARALGGNVIGRDRVAAPGPGHSGRDRSLVVTLDAKAPDGFVCFSHAGDDWALCKDHVRQRLGWPQWQPGRNRRVSPSWRKAHTVVSAERHERSEDELIRIARAVVIWDEAVDPRGTLAEQYSRSRALVLGDDVAGTVLRYHPACPWRDEDTSTTIYIPALIAAFRSVGDDAITAIHRIRLDQGERWPKAERRMFGVVHRAAVKLDPIGATLHIGEGVETCLAARQLGHAPAWALGSAVMVEHFPLISGVTCLRILAERCPANAHAVKQCADRWYAAGRRVQIGSPDDERDKDFNDQVMREGQRELRRP